MSEHDVAFEIGVAETDDGTQYLRSDDVSRYLEDSAQHLLTLQPSDDDPTPEVSQQARALAASYLGVIAEKFRSTPITPN